MKRIVSILIIFCMALPLSGCAAKENYISGSFFAMDTVIELKIAKGDYDAEELFDECEKIVSEIENDISSTAEGSSTFIANTDIDVMLDSGNFFEELLTISLDAAQKTDGAFDVTVGTLKQLWENAASGGKEPQKEDIEKAKTYVGQALVSVSENKVEKAFKETRIDFGAVGKGYAEEKVVEYLISRGVSGGIISFGGNIAVFGEKSDGSEYRVSVRDPFDAENILGVVSMESGYVSVSGDYERFIEIDGKKYNHIIDPLTGYPVDNGVHSAAVVCEDGALADILSTALFVMGKERAIEFWRSGTYDFEAIIVTDDGVFATAGLQSAFDARKGLDIVYEER
ncbi:MAG: FAD:protein FMN transferase [Eubacteriales bacterium]